MKARGLGLAAIVMPGEFDFIEWLKSQQRACALVGVAAGDDLAVLKWPAEDLLLVGVDQVLDGVHFDSAVHTARQIGAKVMNRNLSDCAAMACLPAAAVVSAALPRNAGLEYAKALYLGMKEAGAKFDCEIVGGDTGTWAGRLALSVTILGRSAGIAPVTRAGARVGDGIYVSGALGGSILGRHLWFEPRIALARELAGGGEVSAMIDVSDGLSRDLANLCMASGVGALIEAARVPVHEDAVALSRRDGVEPLLHALHDGEDHELLYTCRGLASAGVMIGRIVEGAGVFLEREGGRVERLEARGWEHRM
jgi:thiamine-monophosphate kinase